MSRAKSPIESPQDEPVVRQELLEPGAVIADKYRIISVLGKGGVGVVYKAQHLLLKRPVAIKTLHSAVDSRGAKRFGHEAQAASAVAHPHIVHVDDYGVQNGHAYLVLELLEGKTLDQIIDESGPLPFARFLDVFIQAADALGHAHQKGFIHRDIKCSNLMLISTPTKSDFLKIVDFGLAKLVESEEKDQNLTQSGTVVGSPLYMSPEQCRGFKADSRSDIYAVGCVMYRALTGSLPLVGQNVLDTMSKHLVQKPQELTVTNPDVYIPYRLQQLVMRMLEKRPEDRPQSMEEIGEALKRMLPTTPVNLAMAPPMMSFTTPKVTPKPTTESKSSESQPDNRTRSAGSSFRLSSTNIQLLRWAYVPLFIVSTFAPYLIYTQFHSKSAKSGTTHKFHLNNRNMNSERSDPYSSAAGNAASENSASAEGQATGGSSDGQGTTSDTIATQAQPGSDAVTPVATESAIDTASNAEADIAYSQAQEAREANDLPRAISFLNKASSLLGPNNINKRVVLMIEIGDCYTQQGNPAEAKQYYTEAAKLAPPESELYKQAANRLSGHS